MGALFSFNSFATSYGTTGASFSSGFQLGINYVVVPSVQANASGQIIGEWEANPAASDQSPPIGIFNGFQLISGGTTIPEPGTLALLAAGLAGLLCYAWRKRR